MCNNCSCYDLVVICCGHWTQWRRWLLNLISTDSALLFVIQRFVFNQCLQWQTASNAPKLTRSLQSFLSKPRNNFPSICVAAYFLIFITYMCVCVCMYVCVCVRERERERERERGREWERGLIPSNTLQMFNLLLLLLFFLHALTFPGCKRKSWTHFQSGE